MSNIKCDRETPSEKLVIAGCDISSFSLGWKSSICITGSFILYICYGALQERIFASHDMRPHSIFLTFYQFGIYLAFSFVEHSTSDHVKDSSVFKLYFLLAVLTLGTITFSNASVGYLNYPTQVIFKCCKMIPVLIGGVFIQGKHYHFIEVIAVLLMTLGLIFFTLVDVTVQPTFNALGILLVSIALCCDGMLGNFQEVLMRKHKTTHTEIIFYSSLIGFVILLVGLALTGQLVPGVVFFNSHAVETYGYGFLFSVTGYFGIQFVLCLVHLHGALTAVTVTTFRKAVSIVLSFVLFEKPFAQGYIWSGLVVVAGLYLNVYSKQMSKWNEKISAWTKQWLALPKYSKTTLPV